MKVSKIIELAGGVYPVAKRLGITRQAVQLWISNDRIPTVRVKVLSKLANVRPSEIRPDIFDKRWEVGA